VIACGGGTGNFALLSRLRSLVGPVEVDTSAQHGIDPQHVEASAFAWFARRALQNIPGNLPLVTGARGPRVLGAVYPA